MFLYQDVIKSAIGLQDGIGMDDLMIYASGIITTVTAYMLLSKTPPWRWVRSEMAFRKQFKQDWLGIKGDDGHIHIPGVMQRLNRIDGEVSRNGGASLKDAVIAVQKDVKDVKEDVAAVKETVDSMTSGETGLPDNRIRNRPEHE